MKSFLFCFLLYLCSFSLFANEQMSQVWDFPIPDQMAVEQNHLIFRCAANPHRCPVGLKKRYNNNDNKRSYEAKSSATANQINVIVNGNNNEIGLDGSQTSEDDNINSEQSNDPVIDYNHVLNN